MANTYTLTEAVTVDITIDGERTALSFGPGEADLPFEVADLLVAQGFATPTVKGGKSKTPVTDPTPTPAETPEA